MRNGDATARSAGGATAAGGGGGGGGNMISAIGGNGGAAAAASKGDQHVLAVAVANTAASDSSMHDEFDGSHAKSDGIFKKMKQGVFGVLFVMAKDSGGSESTKWAYLLLIIQFLQVRPHCALRRLKFPRAAALLVML
jgi:hypothetical protein